jgi:hypothetical protein
LPVNLSAIHIVVAVAGSPETLTARALGDASGDAVAGDEDPLVALCASSSYSASQ